MKSAPASLPLSSRIAWVDYAKAVGITLVFYGHFVGAFVNLRVPAALDQMKWIYSFHMPMFFLLVGLVYKDRDMPLAAFIKRQIRTRMVPVWVFNVVAMFACLLSEYLSGESRWIAQGNWLGLIQDCGRRLFEMVVHGRAAWNVVTWFLICLFTVELIQFGLRKYVRTGVGLVASIACFAVLAVLANRYREAIYDVLGERANWWEVHAALAAVVFYQLGILLRRLGFLTSQRPFLQRAFIAAACLAATLLTFKLNGALDDRSFPVVLMIDAQYGNIGWFFLTALAGTFFVVYLSQLFSASRALLHVGQITLSLMCLNGVLESAVNRPVARWLVQTLPDANVWLFTGICVAGTLLELLVCIPATWLLMRYAPFLLGRGFPKPDPAPQAAPAGE